MEQKNLETLAAQLNLTQFEGLEPEKYILTPEEEENAVNHALKGAQELFAWKMNRAGYSKQDIAARMARIEWEKEVDRDDILKKANSNKSYAIWQNEQRAKEKQAYEARRKELVEAWDAKQMFRLMQFSSKNDYGKDFIVNQYNKPLIIAVCYFLSRDPRFETELKYDFKKGLLIRGISGLGKTYVIKCVKDNMLNPILFLSMLDITAVLQQEGEFFLEWGDKKVCYLDDVGTEQGEVVFFGTRINWFKEFIENYYSKNKVFNRLMISTNLSFKEIEEKYGFRVRSRMKEMFNVIDVTGEDMRK